MTDRKAKLERDKDGIRSDFLTTTSYPTFKNSDNDDAQITSSSLFFNPFFQSLQVQLCEAKSATSEPESELSKTHALKATTAAVAGRRQLQRLQDQLDEHEKLQSGLEKENQTLRRVNQSCKEELESLAIQLEEKEREMKKIQRQQQQQQIRAEQEEEESRMRISSSRRQHNRVLEVSKKT